eukprot:CAMPEP_0184419724 /NCGR_PEP_ID=MMETSP0738-20130409/42140_1 /TAXON_ID=385413 /ORGANISM="Thalassiosira miniscula, Strain CCMP1093" /LENGTH=145 /DNA_ID=CAMNT_0026780311 /DNA_START=10 /DNA_END=443 /DNA_ORIENTATION=-
MEIQMRGLARAGIAPDFGKGLVGGQTGALLRGDVDVVLLLILTQLGMGIENVQGTAAARAAWGARSGGPGPDRSRRLDCRWMSSHSSWVFSRTFSGVKDLPPGEGPGGGKLLACSGGRTDRREHDALLGGCQRQHVAIALLEGRT